MSRRTTLSLLVLAACTPDPIDDPRRSEPDPVEQPDTPDTLPAEDTEPFVPADTSAGAEFFIRLVTPPELHPVGEERYLRGRAGAKGFTPDQLTLELTSSVAGAQTPPVLEDDGRFRWDTSHLAPGLHEMELKLTTPEGGSASARVDLYICEWPPMEDFSSDPTGSTWMVFGDAHWEPQGWLEVTDNLPSRAGSIYRVSNKVNPGDFKIEFRIATGLGDNTGADGFSVNIIDVWDVAELTEYVEAAANGGCLGYGVSSGCLVTPYPVEAFHVEIDTWYNSEPFIADPTQSNHIAINLDGNPGGHPLWAAVPTLEDDVWRHIVVEAQGQNLTVHMDGVEIMNAPIPGFSFDGGYIGVSGSTGWATNFHRFDDLRVYDRCTVPTP